MTRTEAELIRLAVADGAKWKAALRDLVIAGDEQHDCWQKDGCQCVSCQALAGAKALLEAEDGPPE